MTVIEYSESAGGGRAAGACEATDADQGDRGRRLELAGVAFVIQFPPFFSVLTVPCVIQFPPCFNVLTVRMELNLERFSRLSLVGMRPLCCV